MTGVKMKTKKPRVGSESDETLCCCEYINQRGERSHLAACLCDCEDLDEACDRWISCKSLHPEVWARAIETATDRFRVPWIRGAKKVDEVFNKGHIGWGHFLTITCGLLMTLMLLAKAKQDPGYLTRSPRNSRTQSEGGRQFANGDRMEGDKDPQCGFTQINTVSTEKNWCRVCQLVKPPRSGHCRICGVCVRRMDHHCVWINNCIGEWNHKFFLLLLLSFLFTSTYGIILTLNILCKGRNVLTALFYCPGVYRDYSSAFSYTCVWYCTIVTAGMSYVLLLQLFNISYNVTEREARIALREKTGRCILGGLVVDTGTFNQGFFQNWVHFLSMNSIQAERNLDNIV
ncbi:palmitoyltransferase ZDHHC23 isoform 2-T2 [Rhinophrynus dorsalis]